MSMVLSTSLGRIIALSLELSFLLWEDYLICMDISIWTEHVANKKVLKKIGTRMKLILRVRKK